MTWPHPLTHWTTQPPNYPGTHMGGGISTNHYLQTEDILIRSRFIKLLLIWPDPTHWPSQLPTHQPMGGGVSTNHKSSNRIESSWYIIFYIFSHLTWLHSLIHPTTHPWVRVFLQIINLLTELIRSRFIKFLVIWPDPTHCPTDPPTQSTHLPTPKGGSLESVKIQ